MKKTLIFIHGIGLGEWIFHENFAPYYRSRGYEVHTFNLPGHGGGSSEAEKQRITMDTCVRFVGEYLRNNVGSPHVIVGMSMGAAICQQLLAGRYPPRDLRGMALLSPVPPMHNLAFTLRLCRKLAHSNPGILIDFFSEKTNPQLMFSPESLSALPAERIAGHLNRVIRGFARLEYEIFFQDLIAKPFATDVPLKIIGGQDDLLFPPEVAQFTASYYSRQAEILPGLGHIIPLEPRFMRGIESIDSFLDEVFL